MNKLQSEVFAYLTGKISEDRKRGLRMLIDEGFFDHANTDESKKKLESLVKKHEGSFCDAGLSRFRKKFDIGCMSGTVKIQLEIDAESPMLREGKGDSGIAFNIADHLEENDKWVPENCDIKAVRYTEYNVVMDQQ